MRASQFDSYLAPACQSPRPLRLELGWWRCPLWYERSTCPSFRRAGAPAFLLWAEGGSYYTEPEGLSTGKEQSCTASGADLSILYLMGGCTLSRGHHPCLKNISVSDMPVLFACLPALSRVPSALFRASERTCCQRSRSALDFKHRRSSCP